jgi:hypothetical protein
MGIRERYETHVLDMYERTHPGVDRGMAASILSKYLDDTVVDIPCTLHNNVTKEVVDTSVMNVFEWLGTRQPIISGNATYFMQHEEYTSPASIMLESLMKLRDSKKKIMYSFEPGTVSYENAKIGQLSVKVIMNADYGGSATVYSPFYSQYIPPATTLSARNLTTTLICCLELLSGNKNRWCQLTNVNELYDLIQIVLTDETPRPQRIVGNYTVEQVSAHLTSMTRNLSTRDIMVLNKYLSTLDKDSLSKLRMCFDAKHVLSEYLNGEVEFVMTYLRNHQIDLNNMTKESIHASGYGSHAPEEISGMIDHIANAIIDTAVYPYIMNDVEVRANNMQRIIVCVTDTDSLMIHFASYINEFHATSNIFRDSCIMASALGMRLFIEHIIPRFVQTWAENCGIKDPYYRAKFIFKNEFAFLAMTLFAKKMYAASMFVQEGNPRDIHKIAITGLSFKKRDAAEFLEPIMLRLYDQYILTCDNVDVKGLLTEFYDLREHLKANLQHHPEYFKMQTIKDVTAYDPNTTLPEARRGANFWNVLMPDEEMEPLDRVIVIPLSFDLLQQHAMENGFVSELLRLNRIGNEKQDRNPVICLPEHYKHIPDWIANNIDVEYAIDKLLTPFKQLLGLFNVNMPPTRGGMIASRMICLGNAAIQHAYNSNDSMMLPVPTTPLNVWEDASESYDLFVRSENYV